MARILLVDDDEDYSQVVKMRLQKEGYEVDWASGGEKAAQVLTDDFNYNLIIMDVEMPEKNGMATLAYLRGHFEKKPGGFNIPVMIATGLVSQRLRDIFTAQRVAGYIQTPFETSDLIDQIEKILVKKG